MKLQLEETTNSGRNLPLKKKKEESTNQAKPSLPPSPEEIETELWITERMKKLNKSRFKSKGWFKPDYRPSLAEAKQAMYYEKEVKREMTAAINPYNRISAINFTSVLPDGSPAGISPYHEKKEEEWGNFLGNIVGNMTKKYETDNDGRVSKVYEAEVIPEDKFKQIEQIVLKEHKQRSIALKENLIDFEENNHVEEQERIEMCINTISAIFEKKEENEANNDSDQSEEEDDGECLHHPSKYEFIDQEEELFGNGEYLPSDLGWEPCTEEDLLRFGIIESRETEKETDQLIQISSLVLEDENEPAFKPDKEEKEKIRESFFGGFSEEDSEDSSNSSEHNFSSRERRLKSNMTRQTIHQSYLESRLKVDKKRFSHLPETDDIYYQLDQQYNQIQDEETPEWDDDNVPGLYLEASTFRAPPSYHPSATKYYREFNPTESGLHFKEEYEWLKQRHPRFFQPPPENLSSYVPFASVPSMSHRMSCHDYYYEPMRKHEIANKESNDFEKTKDEIVPKPKQPHERTTAETLGQFFRDRFPISSGNPTIKSESDYPVNPNEEINHWPWKFFLKLTGNLIESDLELSLFKSCFQAAPGLNLLFTLSLLALLVIGRLIELPSIIMSTLMIFLGGAIFNTSHLLYMGYRQYKKRKKTREDDLRRLKPRKDKETTRHPSMHPGLQFHRPEGPYSHLSSKSKRRRKLHIERPRISEMEIDLIGERPYLPITLDDKTQILALIDSGSTSCTIKPSILAELEKTVAVPRATKEYKIAGVIPGITKSGADIAFINLNLAKGYVAKNVPMVVSETGSDMIIGSNLIRSHRWANYWSKGKYFIDIGETPHKKDITGKISNHDSRTKKKKREPIEAFFLPSSVVKGLSISTLVLEPKERKIIPLQIPALEGLKNTNFHHSDLMAIDIGDGKNPALSVTPCMTKLKKKKVAVQVVNKTDLPLLFEKGMEIANIQMIRPTEDGGDLNILNVSSINRMKKIFDSIPRVNPMSGQCFCETGRKEEKVRIDIQFADKFGLTSTSDNLVTNLTLNDKNEMQKMRPLKPGLHLRRQQGLSSLHSILVVPDDDGGFSSITRREIKSIKVRIEDTLRAERRKASFFFLNPLTEVSIPSVKVIVDLYATFKFQFLDVKYTPRHPECVNFSMRRFPPEIITGTHVTKLHIQSGTCKPPPDLLRKDKGTPIFKTSVMGATVFMFKLGLFLMCHLHIPVGTDAAQYNINWKERMLYSFFHEMRRLRVPTDFQITMDGNPSLPDLKHMTNAFRRVLIDTTNRLPPFLEENERCSFPVPEAEEEEVFLPTEDCACQLCKLPPEQLKEEGCFEIFEGNISNVTSQPRPPSSIASSMLNAPTAFISSFTAVDESEFDIPLDPLGQVDEEELYKFLNTHPGCENDDYNSENETIEPSKPKATPTAEPIKPIERNPPPGIPDSFVPGEWREFIDVESLGISEFTKKKLVNLMDRFVNIFSCKKTDCRPIYIDGKPVEVDIELTTDKPVFLKSYPTPDKMSKVLDQKIDELLERDEIVQVDSPYNTPILLTHHNSENKHIAFENRKFRLCLDLRHINSMTKLKNIDSHLVKKIEHLYARIKGKKFFTMIDMTKAYRSLIASEHLRQICAFRTPDSTKYPYHTWAFRSTPDGLAILPGFYSLCIQKCLSKESRECVIQHIDDLLIASDDEESHLRDLERVFTDLHKGNFLISASKLKMFRREATFLGHVVDGTTIDIPEERRSYFDSLQPPTTKKEMQSLLGVAGYMAHFVKNYHMNTGPLFDALKARSDKQTFTLDEEQMKAFLELKKAIKNAEKLHLIDFDQKVYMETDSSLTGTGSILYQEYLDPDEPPDAIPKRKIIRYGSRRFSITESLHHTSLEKEAMGILIGCKTHFYYLFNCPEAIIKTDLKSLITLLSCFHNPESPRMCRLAHRLYSLPFKWTLIHVPGTDIPLADALSRLHPPYKCAFSDRHLRYPDLKRSDIQLPEEWTKDPNLVLTTQDILEAMRKKIVFIEKSSLPVKAKRLRALANYVTSLHETAGDGFDTLNDKIAEELSHIELTAKEHKLTATPKAKKKTKQPSHHSSNSDGFEDMNIFALAAEAQEKPMTSVSPRVLITPAFITKHQGEDEKLHAIIMHLKTTPKGQLKTKIIKKYRLLNDSILCTRKNRRLPFDAPSNLRIVCNQKMTLIIMSILHIMGGHYGINTLARLFTLSYKTKGSIQGFAKIVALCCRSCRLHRPINKRNIPYGRIPIPSEPNHTWHMDHVIWRKESGLWKGRKYEGALNIVDLYSNLLISYLVKDVKAETTMACLKQAFSIMPAPVKIVSDNATGLCTNAKLANFLRRKGVQNVSTITPYNSKGNKSERMHKILRETLQLVSETFKRGSIFDMYTTVVEMINSRPLSLTNHPHIRPLIKDSQEIVTPFSLHYGTKAPLDPMSPMEEELSQEDRIKYKQKWQRILAEHDRLLQEELDERNKAFKTENGLQVGDLVLKVNRGDRQHKENLKYTRNVYEIEKIVKAKFIIRPLFAATSGVMAVNGQDLKPYNFSELLNLLPDDIRKLMGESLNPEDLKSKKTDDNKKTPGDFQDWGLLRIPPRMKLRNRLTPASLTSVPAVSLSQTNTFTETGTRTTLTFSSDDFSEKSFIGTVSSSSGPHVPPQTSPTIFSKTKEPETRERQQPRRVRTVIRRNPAYDGSFIQDEYQEEDDELTEAPNLKTTDKGVRLVSRTIIPPPVVIPFYQPRHLRQPDLPQLNVSRKRKHDESSESLETIEYLPPPVNQINTTPLNPPFQFGRLSDSSGSSPIAITREKRIDQNVSEFDPLAPLLNPSGGSPTIQPSRPSDTLKDLSMASSNIPRSQEAIVTNPASPSPPSTRTPSLPSASTISAVAPSSQQSQPSPKLKKTKFSDEQGFPIAEDNLGRKYRLPKSYGINPRSKKMVYIDQTSSGGSSNTPPAAADPSPSTPTSTATSTPAMTTSTSTATTTAPTQAVTRAGRVIKLPAKFRGNEWEMNTPPDPEPASSSEIKQDLSPEKPKKPYLFSGQTPLSSLSFNKEVKDQKIIHSTPINQPTPEQKTSTGPVTPDSSSYQAASLEKTQPKKRESIQNLLPPQMGDLTNLEEDENNENEETMKQNELIGLPASLYETPEISTYVKSAQTPDQTLTTQTPATVEPAVPQPGTRRSLETQQQFQEILKIQDQISNEKALEIDAPEVLSPLPAASPQQQLAQNPPPTSQPGQTASPVQGRVSNDSRQQQQQQQQQTPQQQQQLQNDPPSPPRLYPDLPAPDPLLPQHSHSNKVPKRQRRRGQTLYPRVPPQDEEEQQPRRSGRTRNKPSRYGSDEWTQ